MTQSIPAAQYRQMTAKKANKYGAKRTVLDGITFDSKAEADRYAALKQMQDAGLISHLVCQPSFKLAIGGQPILIRSKGYPKGRQATYVADFAYFANNARVFEDVKGLATPLYKLKRAIVEAMYPGTKIIEVS